MALNKSDEILYGHAVYVYVWKGVSHGSEQYMYNSPVWLSTGAMVAIANITLIESTNKQRKWNQTKKNSSEGII